MSAAADALDASAAAATWSDRVAHVLADAPNRAVAFAADALLLSAATFLGAALLSVVAGPAVAVDLNARERVSADQALLLTDVLLAAAISAVYFVAAWRSLGGSPGQRLLGIRLGNRDGSRLGLGRASLRWLLLAGPFPVVGLAALAVGGLGIVLVDVLALSWYVLLLVSVVRSATKQGLHDRLAGSIVVKRAQAVDWPEAEGVRRAG